MKRPFPKTTQPSSGSAETARRLCRMVDPDMSIAERISYIIRREIDEYEVDTDERLAVLDAFCTACQRPEQITINAADGICQECWAVTRDSGYYRVVFLPLPGVFALCVKSDQGPLDIGVHGSAIGCFNAV